MEMLKKYWWIIAIALFAMLGFKKRKVIRRKASNYRQRYRNYRQKRRMRKMSKRRKSY